MCAQSVDVQLQRDGAIATTMCAQSVDAHLQRDGATVIALCAQSVDAHLQSDGAIAVAMCAQSVDAHLQSDGAIVIAMCAQSVDVQQLQSDGAVYVWYNVRTARWTYGTAELQVGLHRARSTDGTVSAYVRHGTVSSTLPAFAHDCRQSSVLTLHRPDISGLKNGIIFGTKCAHGFGFNLVPRLIELRCWLTGVA